MNRSPLRLGFLLNALALALAWLAPWQFANAQCPQICDAGSANTAFGLDALPGDSGSFNTAVGDAALFSNTTGFQNTASGEGALANNTTGNDNTANGTAALVDNTTGNQNTAQGFEALFSNSTGNNNTATGVDALLNNTTGSFNIAVGNGAGSNLTTGSNNIEIGHDGNAGETNTIRIGKKGVQTKTVIAGIRGTTISGGITVFIDSNGRLGTSTSSARFKENIRPMDNASEAILGLRPVTFRYRHDLDPEGIPQFGLVAEDVEKVNPDLVARDEHGKPYTVRYEAVNAMLLNEFLKEHREVQEQAATIAKQRKDFEATIAQQQKQIDALTARLQKVSAQLEASKPIPQIVANNQ